MQHSLLICDLDGTLIDSRKEVVEALRHACETTGVALVESVEDLVVGPTLDDLVRQSTLPGEVIAALQVLPEKPDRVEADQCFFTGKLSLSRSITHGRWRTCV